MVRRQRALRSSVVTQQLWLFREDSLSSEEVGWGEEEAEEEEDGLTPEEQGLRAVGVEHATREQEMQEFCTAGRSVGGFFFYEAPFVRCCRVIQRPSQSGDDNLGGFR